jgi:hypothetical protein
MRVTYVIIPTILSTTLPPPSHPLSHHHSAMAALIQLSVPINGAEFTNWDACRKTIKDSIII